MVTIIMATITATITTIENNNSSNKIDPTPINPQITLNCMAN